jgi:hypothetical protein
LLPPHIPYAADPRLRRMVIVGPFRCGWSGRGWASSW